MGRAVWDAQLEAPFFGRKCAQTEDWLHIESFPNLLSTVRPAHSDPRLALLGDQNQAPGDFVVAVRGQCMTASHRC